MQQWQVVGKRSYDKVPYVCYRGTREECEAALLRIRQAPGTDARIRFRVRKAPRK